MSILTTIEADEAAQIAPAEQVRRLALENEHARRRQLNNIPDLHLTPSWLELAIAKDWSLLPNGAVSPVRAAAEAEAAAQLAGKLAA